MNWKTILTLVLLLLLAGFAVFCVWYATAPGAGVSPDSTNYIGAARSLLAGKGLTVRGSPLTHFPPLLSVLLAIGGWFGPDPATVVRWLNAVLMGANVFLMGFAIHRTTGAVVTAVLGGALVLAAADIVEVHTWAWSEPAMLFFGLAGLLLLCLYFAEQRPWQFVGAAGCLALALLARYAAIPLIGTALLGILLFRRRLKEVGWFALISCGPFGLWLLRNWLVGGTPTNRRVYEHMITDKRLEAARATMARWLYFGNAKLTVELQNKILWIALGVLLVLLAILIWRTVAGRREELRSPGVPRRQGLVLPWLLFIFAVSYWSFLNVSISYFDANTPLDGRILCPLHFALIGFAVLVLHAGCVSYRWMQWTVGVLLLVAGGWAVWAQAPKLQKTIASYHVTGRGYASEKWQKCQFLQRIRDWPDVPIYMNEVVGTTYHTGRLVRGLPVHRDAVTAQPNAKLAEQLQRMKDDLTKNDGVFIVLKVGGWRGLPRAELFKALNLTSVEKTPEAEVFKIVP